MSELREDPLGQPLAGLVLRCGGRIEHKKIRGFPRRPDEPCRMNAVIPQRLLGDFDQLRKALEVHGWSLAVGSQSRGASEVRDGRLHVPGEAVLDPLCADCSKRLMSRLLGTGEA